MVFSSLSFLFLFLPIVGIGYVIIRPSARNIWLLIASLFFYYLSSPQYLILLFSIIAIAYLSGIAIDRCSVDSGLRRVLLAVSLALMLGVMCYFKYWNFLIDNVNSLFRLGIQNGQILLPVGISFFTFQAISYVVDVYRGEELLKNPVDMALYISFFPQLIAGPIVRFSDIRTYLQKEYRRLSLDNLSEGFWRFSIGLCKKVIFANNLGGLADLVFGFSDYSNISVMYTWLGAVAYTLQIYFDFSGYSDMAIGLGKVFGFEFKENFNYPYSAKSVQDFWRRWHMSLSYFFRDYVYIPLGGNRVNSSRWIVNIAVVWGLTGLWHGAAWHYVMWGALYGVLLMLERKVKIKSHILTMVIVMLLWVIFRADTMSQAISFIKNMFGIEAHSFIDGGFVYQFKNYWLVLVLASVFSLPILPWIQKKIKGFAPIISATVLAIGMIVSVSYIYMGSYNPFLYFMF